MKTVWLASDNIISPLGTTSLENYSAIQSDKTGIREIVGKASDSLCASALDDSSEDYLNGFTKFETLCCHSIKDSTRNLKIDFSNHRIAFILSTTKGNIELINHESRSEKISIHQTANRIFKNFTSRVSEDNSTYVISNACISGVLAIIFAKRLLQREQYDHAIVVGCDILSAFVTSGFQALMAISPEPCKPFDKNRQGISLGEGAASLVLTTKPEEICAIPKIKVMGEGVTNDANHISGPSRTGMELAKAIDQALKKSSKNPSSIGFISAHGTATHFNDEMEAKAFNHAGLEQTPLNSLKGYFGHTLGAAGLVESIVSCHALLNEELIPTKGFKEFGVSLPLNIISERKHKSMNTCLKTASGFGGCNAAMVLEKV